MKPSTYQLIQSFKRRRMNLLARAACYRPDIAARLWVALRKGAVNATMWERRLRA